LIQSDNKECKVKSRWPHLKGFGTTFCFGDLHRRANYRLHRRKRAERTATPLPYLGAEGERQQYQDERFICDSQDLTLRALLSDGGQYCQANMHAPPIDLVLDALVPRRSDID
jgi:hypothetical protein